MASSIKSLMNPNEIRLNLDAPNLDEELTRFNELFELLLANSCETDLDEAVKVARWKILAGELARKKLRECQWEPGEKVTIESMTAKLKGLASGTVGSMFVARKSFWRRKFKPGEGFSTWLADLGAMLTRCSYEKPDEVLRDKIVCFHTDNKLAAQLVVLDKDVSLDTVIAKCRSHELACKHQTEKQLVSNNHKCKTVDAIDQDTDKDNFEADKLQDKQAKLEKNCHSEDLDDVVLRDQSLIQTSAVKKAVKPNPRTACLPECKLKRQHAEAMVRRLDAIAVHAGELAKKVKLESGMKDGAQFCPAVQGSGDGLLANSAPPPDDVEEVTAPTDEVASHPPVRVVDFSRSLEKEKVVKTDVGVFAARTVCDITVGGTTTAGDVDTSKDNATVNPSGKVAVDADTNRQESVNKVQMSRRTAKQKARNKERTLISRERRRKKKHRAFLLRQLEDGAKEPGVRVISNNRAEPLTLSSQRNGQQKSPDAAEGKTNAPVGADSSRKASIRLDNKPLQQEIGTRMDLDVKVSVPIAGANKQKEIHDVELSAGGSNLVKKEAAP